MCEKTEPDLEEFKRMRPDGSAVVDELFTYDLIGDKIIIGGDFNLHHELWGSKKHTRESIEFVNLLTASDYEIANNKTPTAPA